MSPLSSRRLRPSLSHRLRPGLSRRLSLTTRTRTTPFASSSTPSPSSASPSNSCKTTFRAASISATRSACSSAEVLLSEGTRDVHALRGPEEADLVEELDVIAIEGGEDVGVGVGVDEGVADLGGDDEVVLADDVSGLFD